MKSDSVVYSASIHLTTKHLAQVNKQLAEFAKLSCVPPMNQSAYFRCLIDFAKLYHEEFTFFALHQWKNDVCFGRKCDE